MQPSIPIDQMNEKIAWKEKQDRRSSGAIRATAATGEKIAFGLAFRDTLVRVVKEDFVVGERSTLKETRNENVFPDVCRQIEKPGADDCANASTVFRTMLNGPFG